MQWLVSEKIVLSFALLLLNLCSVAEAQQPAKVVWIGYLAASDLSHW